MLSLASCHKFLFFSLSVADYELSLLRLEVVAFNPCVISPLGELFLELCDCVDLVKVLENLSLNLRLSYFSVSDP